MIAPNDLILFQEASDSKVRSESRKFQKRKYESTERSYLNVDHIDVLRYLCNKIVKCSKNEQDNMARVFFLWITFQKVSNLFEFHS